MKCPFCRGMENSVVDSRLGRDGTSIRRRRECRECGRRFTTYERVEETTAHIVKKDGRREPFDRAKLLAGLHKATEKRPVSIADIEDFVDRIWLHLQERQEHEVPSSFLGTAAMGFLRDIDQVAYVRFASVYRSFKDISEFMEELRGLLEEGALPSGDEGEPVERAGDERS